MRQNNNRRQSSMFPAAMFMPVPPMMMPAPPAVTVMPPMPVPTPPAMMPAPMPMMPMPPMMMPLPPMIMPVPMMAMGPAGTQAAGSTQPTGNAQTGAGQQYMVNPPFTGVPGSSPNS